MTVMDLFRLDDKVVIVTGASSGLGVAFAHCFAEAGADVVLGARRVEKLERVADSVRSTGRRVHTIGAVNAPIDAATRVIPSRSPVAETTASAYSDQPAASSSAGRRTAMASWPRAASSGMRRCHSQGSPPAPGIRA